MSARLQEYIDAGYTSVEGWLDREILSLLPVLDEFQQKHRIVGDFCEIGVHHGRLFFALANLCSGSDGLALDVFDDQQLNIDRSGHGNRAIFESGIQQYCPDPARIRVEKVDSTDIRARELLQGSAFRLFSVDGGHTVQHLINDLSLADATLVNGGFVLVDDYCSPGFPGVTEGLILYLQRGGRLLPVCAAGGKMILTTLSFAAHAQAFLAARLRESAQKYRIRETALCGHKYLVYRKL